MREITIKQDKIPIERKNEPQLIKDYDNIRNDVEGSFVDSIVLLTNELQKDVDFSNCFKDRNLSKANKKIPWNEYQKKLEKNIKTYTDMVSDKVLEYEETYNSKRTIKNSVKSWIDTNARTEALDIAEKSKKAFKNNYNGYFENDEEEYPRPLIIKSSLGLPPKYTKAVNNKLVSLRDDFTFEIARSKTKDYIRNLRRRRGELIAKQELWESMLKTRIMLHEHLFMMGKLDKNKIGKRWIARKNTCKGCRELDGEIRQWDENFVGKTKFPGLHVGCYCLYELVEL